MPIEIIVFLSIVGTLLYAMIGVGAATLHKKANNKDKYDTIVLFLWPIVLIITGATQNTE